MNFHFITVVWGQAYTDFYLNVVLPTQISSGNLLAFTNDRKSIYKIYTTSWDAEKIVKSPVYSVLSEVIETQVSVFNNFTPDYFETTSKYQIMNYCHQHAVVDANKNDCALIFLAPDAIFSDGSFLTIMQKANEGKRAVMVSGPVVSKETFLPDFFKFTSTNQLTKVEISSRDLVKLALPHIHPFSKCIFWNTSEYHGWPSHIYWEVPNSKGILARCFHMHPVMINPIEKYVLPVNTVDFYYLETACPNLEDVYVVDDSDEMTVFEISGNREYNVVGYPLNQVDEIVKWAKNHATFHHREFSKHKVKIHCDALSSEWKNIERESDLILNKAYQLLENN